MGYGSERISITCTYLACNAFFSKPMYPAGSGGLWGGSGIKVWPLAGSVLA
jgi:hypothetical protein